jgi:hypothetical protein
MNNNLKFSHFCIFVFRRNRFDSFFPFFLSEAGHWSFNNGKKLLQLLPFYKTQVTNLDGSDLIKCQHKYAFYSRLIWMFSGCNIFFRYFLSVELYVTLYSCISLYYKSILYMFKSDILKYILMLMMKNTMHLNLPFYTLSVPTLYNTYICTQIRNWHTWKAILCSYRKNATHNNCILSAIFSWNAKLYVCILSPRRRRDAMDIASASGSNPARV